MKNVKNLFYLLLGSAQLIEKLSPRWDFFQSGGSAPRPAFISSECLHPKEAEGKSHVGQAGAVADVRC